MASIKGEPIIFRLANKLKKHNIFPEKAKKPNSAKSRSAFDLFGRSFKISLPRQQSFSSRATTAFALNVGHYRNNRASPSSRPVKLRRLRFCCFVSFDFIADWSSRYLFWSDAGHMVPISLLSAVRVVLRVFSILVIAAPLPMPLNTGCNKILSNLALASTKRIFTV